MADKQRKATGPTKADVQKAEKFVKDMEDGGYSDNKSDLVNALGAAGITMSEEQQDAILTANGKGAGNARG
jgi:hypothetical protein